jgi:hypothetical protein
VEQLELTWGRALYLWIGIFWRWALGVLALTLIQIVLNEVTVRTNGSNLFADSRATHATMVIWLVIAFVAFRMTLSAGGRKFRVVLIPRTDEYYVALVSNRSRTPACGGTVLPSRDRAALLNVDQGPIL